MKITISTIRLTITLLLAPVFAGEVAARQLPDPERFESAMRAFEAGNRVNPPPEGATIRSALMPREVRHERL